MHFAESFDAIFSVKEHAQTWSVFSVLHGWGLLLIQQDGKFLGQSDNFFEILLLFILLDERYDVWYI